MFTQTVNRQQHTGNRSEHFHTVTHIRQPNYGYVITGATLLLIGAKSSHRMMCIFTICQPQTTEFLTVYFQRRKELVRLLDGIPAGSGVI